MMEKVLFVLLLSQILFHCCYSYRILNGNEVQTITQFPYQVAIFSLRNAAHSLSSGAIISNKFILTCAHCIKNSESSSIFYGITDLGAVSEENYQLIPASNYIIHPNYTSFKDDIALMLTDREINFNDKVRAVRLPTRSEAMNSENHGQLQLAAWGFYSNAQEISNSLLYVNVQMLPTAECIQIFGASFITEKVICSQTLHCSGDSGSILIDRVSDNSDDDSFLAVGIASFANYETCAEGNNHASAYMRVASYLDFINTHTNLIAD